MTSQHSDIVPDNAPLIRHVTSLPIHLRHTCCTTSGDNGTMASVHCNVNHGITRRQQHVLLTLHSKLQSFADGIITISSSNVCYAPTSTLSSKHSFKYYLFKTLEAVVIASALNDMYRLKAVLQLLAIVCLGDIDICRKSIWRPPSCCTSII